MSGLLAVIGALVVLAWPPAPADAHGSTQEPASRVFACRFNQPDNPMCAQAWSANSQALYDWMEVNIGDAAGRHREIIPDGQLCSAGRSKYAAFDRPGTWPVTALQTDGSGLVNLIYQNTAPHATEYYRVYITRPGFDARADSLGWGDLELVHDSGPLDRSARQDLRVPLPDRTTPAVLYIVWQRSDSPEAFYACSDVTVNAGAGPAPTTSGSQPVTTTDPPAPSTSTAPSATSPTLPPSSDPTTTAQATNTTTATAPPPPPPPTTPSAPATTPSSSQASAAATATTATTAASTSSASDSTAASDTDNSADDEQAAILVAATEPPTGPDQVADETTASSLPSAALEAGASTDTSTLNVAALQPTLASETTDDPGEGSGGTGLALLAVAILGAAGLALLGVSVRWQQSARYPLRHVGRRSHDDFDGPRLLGSRGLTSGDV